MMATAAMAPVQPGRDASPAWSATIDLTPSAAPATVPGAAQAVATTTVFGAGPAATLDDAAIVRAVLDGNRDAFRLLVEREGAAVIRACQRVLGDLHEAEDVAQEAFVIAYRSLASWRAEGPFAAWLSRIAVREAVRRASRRREVTWASPEPVGEAGGTDAVVAHGAARTAQDPAIHVMDTERTAAIRLAVAKLDEPYREVVTLRFFAERSLNEIAAETGRPLATVKTHLRRGLLRLRERLDEGDHR